MSESKFNMMTAFLAMGDIGKDKMSIKERIAYKERIVFATMRSMIRGWEPPEDWDEISDKDKLERLIKIEKTVLP